MSHNYHNPIHASAVSVGDMGALILGASGSGKSALALDMIARGAQLVSDDRVLIENGRLRAPAQIAGLIEQRGVGLIRVPHRDAALHLVVQLDEAPVGRLPQCEKINIDGRDYPLIAGKGVATLASGLMILLRDGVLIDPEAL